MSDREINAVFCNHFLDNIATKLIFVYRLDPNFSSYMDLISPKACSRVGIDGGDSQVAELDAILLSYVLSNRVTHCFRAKT